MQSIGRYRIVEELGRGGMGIVYRAIDPLIDRPVALKTLRNTEGISPRLYEELRERFLREARAAGRLSHPSIVAILDAGTDEASGVSFIAMEFVAGKDLESELRAGVRFTPDQAARIVAEVAAALAVAHEQGIVHRDVKPANLLRDAAGRIKIADFGIARLSESGLTQTGQVLGSPAYMSPEQISGAPVDGRSDIFSLGVVFYELLSGERPFLGEGLTALSYQIVNTEPIPVRRLNPGVPARYEQVVARALAKDPAERYASAADLAADLREDTILGQVASASSRGPQGGTGTLVGSPPASSRGTGTLLEPRAAGAGLDGRRGSGTLVEPEERAPGGRRARPLWLGLGALALLLAVILGVALTRPGTKPSSSTPAGDARAPDRAAPEPPRASDVPSAPAAELPSDAAPEAAARLLLDFEHHLSDGSVSVFVDDELIWEAPLRARKQTRLKVPGWNKGPSVRMAHQDLADEVELPAGVRRIRVQVKSPASGVDDTETTQLRLRAGRTNILKIRVSRVTRRIELSGGS